MDYKIDTVGDITVISLKGAFDRSAHGDMEMELLSLVRFGSDLIIDLSGLTFISSTGLHFLLDLYRRCKRQSARLALAAPSAQVSQVLTMTGIQQSGLPVYYTLEDGLTALHSTKLTESGSRGFSEDELPGAPQTSYDIPKMEEKDEVNFSAFYPREVTVNKWYTLLVYMYIPSALEAVRVDARKFEDEIGEMGETKPATTTQLARGTEVTIVPSCEGVTFNPERITFQWLEDQHRAQFRMKADPSLADMGVTAWVTIYVGPLIVGTLKMGMLFNETESSLIPARSEEVNAHMYHQDEIFISYSHRDTEVVKECQVSYEALGFNVMIDSLTLRSGQKWNDELMRMIERADIFQLFWSENSSQSEYCRQEWQHALGLKRGEGFIRPVYWKEPIPDPPDELSNLHFDFAPFSSQG